MKKLILLLIFGLLEIAATAQVQLVSGVPVLININSIDDYENGKECTYTTVVKYTFTSIPTDNIYLKIWADSPNFDGPSTDLTCQYVRYQFVKATINNMSNLLEDNGGSIYYFVNAEKELVSGENQLMNFKFTSYSGSSADVYFFFKFSIRVPAAGGTGKLTEKNPGYYLMNVNFNISYNL